MKPHVVKQGECLQSIAALYGTTAEELHDHAKNAKLKEARPDASVLHPGDVVWVPDPPEPPSISSGGTHRYKAKAAVVRVQIAIQDGAGNGLEDKPYRLKVGRASYEGRTDSDGTVDEKIPVYATLGDLAIWPGGTLDEGAVVRFTVHFGGLDPTDKTSGIAGRLQNLGFDAQRDFAGAVAAFQASRGLEPSGQPDAETQSALKEVVGV